MDKIIRSPTLIFFLVLAVVALGVGLSVVRPAWRGSDGPMSSAERAAELAKQGMREQIVSFGSGLIALPELVPVGEVTPEVNLFAVPVGQITLHEPETRHRTDEEWGSYRGFRFGGNQSMSDGSSSPRVRGDFNNVLIYDKRTRAVTKVFEARTAISMFRYLNQVTPRVIVFVGTAHDSSKDGQLDRNDMQQLFVYTLGDAKLHQVSGLDASVDDVEIVNNVDYLVVAATVDRNKNGKPERQGYQGEMAEPTRLYRIDLKTMAASPLVDETVVQDLQSTLDGVKAPVTK